MHAAADLGRFHDHALAVATATNAQLSELPTNFFFGVEVALAAFPQPSVDPFRKIEYTDLL